MASNGAAQGQDHRLGAVVLTGDGRFDRDQYQIGPELV
jgi:hypothetical protein